MQKSRINFINLGLLEIQLQEKQTQLRKLTFKRRIKSHLPFAGIIRSSQYSPRFQDNG